MYSVSMGEYPTTDQGLDALATEPPGSDVSGRWKPQMEKIPTDPWRNAYVYQQPGSDGAAYDIMSYGKDGAPGGSDYNSDITNHNMDDFIK